MSARWVLLIGLFCILTLTYILAAWLNLHLLQAPDQVLQESNFMAVGLSLALLAADTFLPTPSTIVLIADGYLFGPWAGTLIAVCGLMLGNALGFMLARYGSQWLAKKFPLDQRGSTEQFMQKWGRLALAISRPIPVLAESVLLLAGSTQMSFTQAMLSCLLGTIPFALTYVLVGHYALSLSGPLIIISLIALVLAIGFSLGYFSKRYLGKSS